MSRNETEIRTATAPTQPPRAAEQQLSLFAPAAMAEVEKEEAQWRRGVLDPILAKKPFWKKDFTTVSGMDVQSAGHAARRSPIVDPIATSAIPGEFPYTRGIHPTGYRGKLWTMRQFAGFGTAAAHQRALQVPPLAGADRPLRRLPPADALRLRLRPSLQRTARSASAAWPSTRWPTWRSLFDGINLERGHASR